MMNIAKIRANLLSEAQAGLNALGSNTDVTAETDFNNSFIVLLQQIKKLSDPIKTSSTKIVGVNDLVFRETSQKYDGTLSLDDALTETVDFTSEPDRATIRLYNGRGYDVYLTRMLIEGKPITQSKGVNGSLVLDSLKRDDDIRRNGENVKVISNDYIFDATQVQKIADHAYKNCGMKRHLYSLQVHGSALWYEPGDWYTLSLGGAGTNEYIDATVEIVSVSVQRTAGGIGSTSLLVRECMESWSKTTLYTARLVTGASPKRRTDQSNVLRVASSSFYGTYYSRCDGTADDVQIQAAIDYLAANGGGTVQLTAGTYTCGDFALKPGVTVVGVGNGTIISSTASASDHMIISNGTSGAHCTGIAIRDIKIVSAHNTSDNTKYAIYLPYTDNSIIENVTIVCSGKIAGININNSTYTIVSKSTITGMYGVGIYLDTCVNIKILGNSVYTSTASYGDAGISAFSSYCEITNNTVYNISGPATNGVGIDVAGSNNVISNCTVRTIAGAGAGNGFGIYLSGTNGSVVGNLVTGCDYGIYVSGLDIVVTGNRAFTCGAANFSDAGTRTINSGNSFV
jgi:parallel beta-helix repeat protein